MLPIHLDKISKTYGESASAVPTVSVDFTVEQGEFFTLLGPSGCGKSTLLRMVAGFIAPTEGRIRFAERDVTKTPAHKRDIGMVFQNYALFPHMSVAANVAYGLKMRKVDRAVRSSRVAKALQRVGLEDYGERRIDQLSGGQQQRVALARAIVVEPGVLLLDEPLSNLDAKLREETRMQIREVQKAAETTALYVTHDQSEAMAMSDRIAVLEGGRAHQIDTPQNIYNEPATTFVARFIGRSNVIVGEIVSTASGIAKVRVAGADVEARRDDAASVSVGESVALSIRPESLEVSSRESGQLRGVVFSREFLGSTAVLEVDLEGVEQRITVSTPDVTVGEHDRIGLTVGHRAGWVIPQ